MPCRATLVHYRRRLAYAHHPRPSSLQALGSGLSFMHVVNKLCVEACEASSMACGPVPLSLANELAQARVSVLDPP